MKQIPTLDQTDAKRAIKASSDKANELKVVVTIAVVDSAGMLLALSRMDGARSFTVDLATRKARTAAALGIDTAILQQHAGSTPLSAELLALAGGLPHLENLQPAGAVGVSGAKPEIDSLIAQAGIEAISSAH